MRIGLYEYVTAELAAEAPASLRREGRAMLAAVADDFLRIPGVTVFVFSFTKRADLLESFEALVKQSDYTLVIAPEFDDILLTRCRRVEDAGGRLLGPSSTAVRLAADKLLLSQVLSSHGILTPPTLLFDARRLPPREWQTAVVKPRWGAGSQATYWIEAPYQSAEYAALPQQSEWSGEAVVQPYLAGQPASVAFLLGPHQTLALRPATQTISTDGRCRYLGGRVPLPEDLAARAVRLAARAVAVVPGLRGYVGVDLILGDDPSGVEDMVLEINPRLTTSYVGLRALARSNLAEAMLRIITGADDVAISWRRGVVRFDADGTVEQPLSEPEA